MTLTPVSHFADAPADFDHISAEVVYGIISKLDDETAEMFADILVGSLHQGALLEHESTIAKCVAGLLDKHGDDLRAGLTSRYVAKRAAGESVVDVVAAAELISKAFEGPGFSAQARAERAKKQQRDLITGQFVHTHHEIAYDGRGDKGERLKPADDRMAQRHMGIPAPTNAAGEEIKLTPSQKLAYQQAYAQVQAIVAPYQRNPEGKFLHLHYAGSREPELHPLPGRDEELPVLPAQRLSSVSVSVVPGHESLDTYDTYGAVRDAVSGQYPLGVDETGTNAGVDRIRTFDAGVHGGDPFAPTGARTMGRLGASAQFLDESFKNKDGESVLPRRVQAALKAGQVVGTYGPEAANVIGPHADRAAYRYRGTERVPDRSLLTAMESLRRNPTFKTPEDRREVAIHGLETETGWRPSGMLNYFRSRLPNADLNALQRKSGTIPPSEGVIFDSKGRVVTQAVGYGDDHYLPFNLRNLRGLKGGEYIRTRTWGGPTTEDIYTGLIAGADSVSVVSHNGTYTVEFDKGFKGKRRYNDKAARMVARYGYLLDAVKNGEITTGSIHPSKMTELREQAAASADPDLEPEAYRAEFDRLLARERRNPTFSAEQRAEASQGFLDNEALKHKTPDGHEMTRTEMIDDWLNKKVSAEMASANTRDPDTRTALKTDLARTYGLNDADPIRFSQNAVRAMGTQERFDRYVEREEQTYRASLKPLELNGPGYQLALEALQEQFPYYIKSVDYHPWVDARQGRDTGYVKPKANRPAAALSGYFDDSINGQGKVLADTTRGQAKQAAPYRGPAQRAAERAREAVGNAGAAIPRRVGALGADAERELRITADNDLLAHLREKRVFGSGFHGAGKTGLEEASAARGRPLSDFGTQELTRVSPDLTDLTALDRLTPDERHGRLTRLLDDIEKHSALDLDSKIVANFRRSGKAADAKAFDRNAMGDNLREQDAEYNFGRIYQRGSGVPVEEIERAFKASPIIGRVVPKEGLNQDSPLDVSAFDEPAQTSVLAGLQQRHNAIVSWQRNSANPLLKPKGADQLPHDIEGFVRARQLRRRYEETEAAAAAVASEAVEEGGFGFIPGSPIRIELALPGGGVATPITPEQRTFNSRFDDITSRFNE